MGRNRKRRQPRQSRDDEGADRSERRPYILLPKENELFEFYYQGQNLVPTDEWKEFMEALRQPLPCTFRITGFRSHSKEMLRIIKEDYAAEMMNIEIDGRNVRPAKCLTWYPGELAWQLDLERKLIRHDQTLRKLHRFLVQETESGNISRQETVSMIPPLVLDVQPNSKVLDMCAAPGSKTAQLIEFLHAADENGSSSAIFVLDRGCESGSSSDGFVIANDSDNKRCYLMVHQIGRLLSPNFAVTNMDASNLPKLVLQNEKGDKKAVKFDRILCDVPCSGDGTLRKNVDAWQRWNPAIGHGLHNLQVRILKRGLEMLTVGGRIVYSTCSFNPVENEAVVATALRNMAGTVELVDISDRLPGLLREPGRSTWRVMSKQRDWFDKFEDVPDRLRTQITPSSFPPTSEEAEQFKLERCIRILPHKQNTGGFFVAVMEKRRSLKEETKGSSPAKNNEKMENASTNKTPREEDLQNDSINSSGKTASSAVTDKRKLEDDDDICEPMFKRVRHYGYREDPFIFLKQDDEMWYPVREFFGISEDFPFSQLMVRCDSGKKRNIYFVSQVIKDLVIQNEDRFKFINLGVKILSRSASKAVECEFRLVQDGLHILFPYITRRIVRLLKDDVITLLSSENPYISRMSKTTEEQLMQLDQGGCVFIYEPDPSQDGPACQLLLCGWKGKISCRSFIPKFERGHFLRLCGVELVDKADRKSEQQTSGSNPEDAQSKAEEDLNDLDESDLPADDVDGDLEPSREPDEFDDEPKEIRNPDETRESEQIVELVEAQVTVEIAVENAVDDEAVSKSVDN